MGSRHDDVAKAIAAKFGGNYNPGKGVDIVTNRVAIEVETERTITDARVQLQGHRKPAYIAVTNKRLVEKAIDATKGTTIGVIDSQGNVVKRSPRRRQ